MCAPPPSLNQVLNLATRSALDVVTGGAAEIGGASSKAGQAVANYVSPSAQSPAQTDLTDKTQKQAMAAQAQLTAIGPAQTSPQISDQAVKAQADARKRRQALAFGMMSTVGTGGVNPTPSLVSQPQAFAGGKTLLGA